MRKKESRRSARQEMTMRGLLLVALFWSTSLGTVSASPMLGGRWVESPLEASEEYCDPEGNLLCAEWEIIDGLPGPKCCVPSGEIGSDNVNACLSPLPRTAPPSPGGRDDEPIQP
ncbi:MAG: hypothetical protein K0U98_05060 [Deltaproteobacteria bacterium]|nr:hypothetical protein [Deltaproteobacteria bacterium]